MFDPLDLVQGVRQHHLVQRRVEADRTDPVEVTGRPRHLQVWRAASTLAQQERAQPMACPKLVLLRSLSRPDEVAERFVFGIWHPHRRQGAGAGAPSELERIPTVGLHAIPGLHEHERRGDDVAVHPEAEQVPVQPGAGWAGLVAGTQLVGGSELANQSADGVGSIGDPAEAADLASGLGNRDRDGRGVDIKADELYVTHGPALLSHAALRCDLSRHRVIRVPAKRRPVLSLAGSRTQSFGSVRPW